MPKSRFEHDGALDIAGSIEMRLADAALIADSFTGARQQLFCLLV
jgi:hypothetical protein